MRQLTTIAELRDYRQRLSPTESLGLVPTLGNLHAGHLSLIRRGRSHNDQLMVSIFLNPLQFGPPRRLSSLSPNPGC